MSNLLEKFTKKKITEYTSIECDFNSFNVGDTVNVGVSIKEGANIRVQNFQGICIAKRSRGISSSFIVRKLTTSGDAIEKNFKIFLSSIDSVKVIKRGVVRRARLYYLRNRSAKQSRIKEKFEPKK
ncbi:MAG: large subunit ribosomal protein L19 [Candidatus Deianiraeaceae bacterium]|jgi:large subunit ribosomal protein L19